MSLFKQKRFKKEFGFEPTPKWSADCSGLVISSEQKVVDERLSELAIAFDSMIKVENALQADLEGTSGAEAILHLRYKATEARQNLSAAKRAFWYAHELAKEAGFSVKDKHRDYLPAGKYR